VKILMFSGEAGEIDASVFLDVKFVPLGGKTVTHNQEEEYMMCDCTKVMESVRMGGDTFTYVGSQVNVLPVPR
jgi:hypothetical protein